MDYDDNDFQSQNLHLAGEGSTKFPPVLQPYALPKFDFDDSLQGHLRFDSLVETEVFLGIESNEDNQWIEDFSRGSSGIEFNSSAAETCSISRRNNVWSEATSSESVEMLLKSVGQEETILRQTIVEESEACDELGSLTKQMEPSLKHDDDILPKIGDDTDLKSTLPQDEIPENFSVLKEDIPVEPCVEDTSKTHEDEFSVDGRSGELDPNAVSVKGGLPMIEEDPFADSKKSDVADRRDINPLVDEYVDHKTQEDFSASGMQVDNMVPCAQNIISSGGELNNEDLQHERDNVGNMNLDGLQTRNDERKEEFHVLSREAENLDGNAVESGTFHLENPLGSTSKVESVGEGNDIENRIINVEEPSSMVNKVVSAVHTAEQCTEDVDSRIPVETRKCDAVLFKDTEFGEPSKVNTHEVSPLAFEGDTNFEGYAVQVSGPEAGISASVEPKVDAIVQLTYGQESVVEKDNLLESSQQLDNEILVSKSEASLSSKEDNKVSKVEDKENSSSHMGGISTVTVCSSAELLREACETGTLKVGQVVFGVSRENLVAEDHVSSSILDESAQICEADKIYGQGDVHKCDIDVSISDKKSTKLLSESSNMDCVVDGSLIVDKGAGISSHCEGSAGNEPVILLDVTVSNESALNATLENAKVASFDMTGVLQPSENVKTIDGVGDYKEVITVSSVGGFTYPDKESTATKISTEARLSTLKESSELETEPGPASESEKDASFDTAGKLLQKTVHQSLPKADTCNAEIQSEVQTVVVNEVNQECIRGTEGHAVICDVAAKEGGAADAVTFLEKREEATVEENLEKASSEASGSLSSAICAMESGSASSNPDKPPGSPNIISTTELSQSEKEKEGVRASTEEEVNRSTDQKAPVAEIDDVETSNSLSVSGDPKGKDSSKDEQSFSFEIGSLADLSRKDTGKNSQPFPSISAGKVLPIVEGSPSTSGLGQMDAKISQDNSTGSPQVSEGQITRGGSKGTHERKTRRSGKTAIGKETPKRGNHVKETTPTKQSERGDKAATASLSPSAIFQFVQSREMQHYGHVEGNSTKPIFVITASASSLPDLNTSASPSTLFQQPFTDLQQVQLRAQIFVYGALIQGTAPEEAHMISAFGGPDGGRNVWENAWRACMERLHSQKSHPITPETPLPSRSGARAPDQASKQSTLQSKGVSSPLGRTSSKGTPTVVNSMIPLSSPLWSMPTPSGDALQSSVMPRGSVMDYQPTLSPLHPFQTPPVRNFVGHNTPWISQGPFRGPWMASSQTSVPDASTRLPNTEAIKLTPVKELSVPHSSGIKHPVVHSGVPTSTSLLDPKKVTASPGKNSTDPKSRKRRKNPVSEDLGQIVLQSQSQPEPVSTPAVTTNLPTSVAFTMPTGFASKATSEKFVISESPISSMDHLQKKADQDVQQRASLSEETLSKVKEARLQAEDAAVLSAAAVSHSQEVWSQLEERKNSGLVSDVEAKLASAAVAVAAAAAVAKAAAAAAKVASNAALQAKLMAEEALVLNGYGNPSQSTGTSLPDSMNTLGQATPASILKGDNRTNSSSSIIIAAKEAVRKRVEAASAATKRAENMDAIVKAAELAAEAISQAGKIVAMGDPLPLTELLEFGPEGYWKVSRESTELVGKSIEVNREQLSNDIVGEGPDTSTKHQKDGPSVKETKSTTHEKSHLQTEMPKESMVDHMRLVDGMSVPIPTNETDSRVQKGRKVSDLAKTIGVVPESEIGSRSTVRNEYEKAAETFKEDSIKEGSHVEVLKDTDGFKAAWFTANVLSLEDGKAYVCYTELQTDNAEGQLKEWVSVQGEGDKVPKIRTARPVTIMRYEGTRKRRRAAMGDYNWSVGDRVDAWIRDSWCEGIITEKNKKDETELTVHFPVNHCLVLAARGETSVVRAWHLRPSLIWKDGEWIEWSNLRENVSASHEGDMPQEKRIKLGSPAAEAKGKDKMLESKGVVELGKSEESRLLDLSENEKLFNVGKNTRNENKPDALRTLRTGLPKEGSRVVIGVPKPGKKRKFMEVSKHYVADRGNKINEPNDSVKFVKYLMPQGSGSRGWKNSTKSSILKEKRVAETKPRGLKTGKPQSVSGRTVPAKDNLSINAVSAPDDGTLTNHSAKVKDSVSHAENASGKHNQFDIGSLSSTLGTAEGPILFSSRASSSDGSSKKVSTSNAKSERANKGKLAPAGGKLAKIEEDKIFNGNSAKSTSEVVEPRRSNRKIQPTSRLLEGLQSSLIISKIPSVSHDKGHKSSNRSASRGNNHG